MNPPDHPTPRTDALAAKDFIPDGLWIAHARRLEQKLASLRAENERLTKQIKDDNRSYGCELRDPNGTIWEQATKDHARAERAEAAELDAIASCDALAKALTK